MGDSELTTKVSNLIDGQVPDYIQADHPIFVDFLRQYYKFLESAQITITGTVDQVLLETASTSFLTLDGTDRFSSNDSSKIVFEDSTGKFEVGETITGGTSKATAKILVDDNETLYISANQRFKEGETITGGTSGATSTLVKYRANPVQNIQQLFEYADPDNTVDHFLNAFKDSFMESIPTSLASGVSKRNLIKQIRDLYAAKGTSEGHKLFFRILLGQEAEIYYPEKDMARVSDGNWAKPIIIRCTSDSPSAVPADMVGKNITGASSGTTAQIIDEYTFQQGSDTVVEFTLREDTIEGTGFTVSETFTGISETADITMQFTVQSIVTSIALTDGGLLYEKGDTFILDTSVGNGQATAQVSEISSGNISDVIIDDAGTGYKVGDAVKFTDTSDDVDSVSARAFVSVVGGRLATEDSTDSTAENILLEDSTKQQLVHPNILLNGTELATAASEPYAVFGTDKRFSDTKSYYYPLYADKRKAQVSATTTGGAIGNVLVANAGSGYSNGTYYAAVSGDGDNQGTATGAVLRIVVRENKIAAFGTTLATETTIHRSGSGYTFGNVRLTSGFTFSDPELTTTSDMGGSDGLILVIPNVADVKANAYVFDEFPNVIFWMPNDNQNNAKSTFDSDIYDLFEARGSVLNEGFQLRQEDGTTGTGLGDKLLSESLDLITDTYGDSSDSIVLETETLSSSDQGKIIKIHLANSGGGYTSLPTLSIISENGANANLIANTNTIGKVTEIKITDNGFKYSTAPDVVANTNFIVKDVTGTFGIGNTFTTHSGAVVAYDADTQKLEIGTATGLGNKPVATETISLEQSGTYNDGIQLEDFDIVEPGRPDHGPVATIYKVVDEVGSGFNLNNSAALGTNILLENEIGKILTDAHDADIFQISLENDGDRLEFNIRLEDNVADLGDEGRGRENILLESGERDRIILDGFNVGGDGYSISDAEVYLVTEHISNNLIFDGTDSSGSDAGDNFIIRDFELVRETDNILLDGTDGAQADQNSAVLLDGTDSLSADAGDQLLLQTDSNDLIFINHGRSIRHVNTPSSRLLGENLDTFVTEKTPEKTNVTSGDVLYNQIIFDGDQSDGMGDLLLEDGNRLLNENSGNNLLLDGTDDSSSDAGSELLMEDETLGDKLVLDGTNTSSLNAGGEILTETDPNFVNTVITDSGGATATIIAQGTLDADTSIGTTVTRIGSYLDDDSHLSEEVIRIQDSHYYQQFSYEVRVNAAVSEYMNELKASVHPAGFAPFGKIAIATEISAGIDVTASGVVDATVDDTFTPELASLFRLIFGPTIKVNHGIRENVLSTDGESSLFDSLLTENGVAIGDKLLEETDGDNLQFESGLDIAIENSPKSGDGSVLLETGTGGGLLLMETALGENGILDKSVSKVTKLSVTPQLVKTKRSYGAPLFANTLPGSLFFDRPGVQLEAGNRDKAPIIMQDNLVLDGFDEYGTGVGDRIVYEDSLDNSTSSAVKIDETGSLSISDIVSLNTVGYIESAGGDRNFTEEPEGSIVFEQSAASDELVLEDFIVFELNADEVRNEVIISENGQNILLETTGRFRDTEVGRIAVESGSEDNAFLKNGSDVNILKLETETDANGYLIGEDDTISAVDRSINVVIESGLLENEKIMTEGSLIEFEGDTNVGTIPERNFGNRNVVPFTREARVHIELAASRLALQDERNTEVFIALDGTDSSSTDAGDNIILNGTSAVLDIEENILLDGTDAAQSDAGSAVILDASASGTDVGENLLLDSTGGRDAGDRIQLMSTNYVLVPGNEGGFVLLNGTDGSSTNAGDELLLESGTLEFLEQNSINVSVGATAEDGGLALPESEISKDLLANFDSTLGTFDSTTITFDAA
tara:strand:- start:6957 stop:12518 length:5562 start_codon:yes stop_codon:yes gene_type:complete